MGTALYCSTSRDMRQITSASTGEMVNATAYYKSASFNDVFTQNKERKAHETMLSRNLKKRECFDSENHPNTVPIILGLDVTGSMGKIPHELIKDGLPTLMGTLTQNGVEDAALLFVAVGDHECDRYPLQVSQFESGDTELDMWLTRTYIESGGGGNKGESYHLAWQVAANHTVTDAWTKRGEKGFVITIGDEPVLQSLPVRALKEIFGDSEDAQASIDIDDILKAAQEKWQVYHIHINHGYKSAQAESGWKQLLGDNCIAIDDYQTVPKVVADIILKNSKTPTKTVKVEKMDAGPIPDNNDHML